MKQLRCPARGAVFRKANLPKANLDERSNPPQRRSRPYSNEADYLAALFDIPCSELVCFLSVPYPLSRGEARGRDRAGRGVVLCGTCRGGCRLCLRLALCEV